MKKRILGFDQERLLHSGLDLYDALILRWIVDFIRSGTMVTREHNGVIYYWLQYSALQSDLPIIQRGDEWFYRRVTNLTKRGFLMRIRENYRNAGSNTFVSPGRELLRLLSEGQKDLHQTSIPRRPTGVQVGGRAAEQVSPANDRFVGSDSSPKNQLEKIDPGLLLDSLDKVKHRFDDWDRKNWPGLRAAMVAGSASQKQAGKVGEMYAKYVADNQTAGLREAPRCPGCGIQLVDGECFTRDCEYSAWMSPSRSHKEI